jgi:ribose 5-phosphate isomerase B
MLAARSTVHNARKAIHMLQVKKMVRIAIGTDHRGFTHKNFLVHEWKSPTHDIHWHDVGTMTTERVDYPLFGKQVCEYILSQKAELGILLCGTGVGMSIIANRYCGIYAGIAWNAKTALSNKQEDNVNVLVLPADFLTDVQAAELVETWLNAEFLGNRYAERLTMIDHIACKK